MKIPSLHELLIAELRDLYDAEHQLTKALPKMAKAASNPELSKAFQDHLAQTHMHVQRLEKAFEYLDEKAARKTCNGMKGLVKEGDEFLKKTNIMPDEVRDAGLISAAQRVEHYEMAAYGCVIAFAKQMGHTDTVEILEQTLNEEKEADKLLTGIAEKSVNPAANEGGMEKDEEIKKNEGMKKREKSMAAAR